MEVAGSHDFRLVERELVDPAPNHVRLRVESCGVCHTDVLSAEGMREHLDRPIVPGHEIVGVIDAVGPGVTAWSVGERVGVGYLGGHCGECDQCRRGDFVNCRAQEQTGYTVDGGYAEVAYARTGGLVRVPEGLNSIEAAPLLCAGLTTFEKEELARKLGADHYIDSAAQDPGTALQELGGAAAVLATAASGASMSPLVAGLAPRGRLVVLGAAPDPIEVQTAALIFGTRSIQGHLTGTPIENEDNLAFSAAGGILPLVETFALDDAPKAYAHMLSGQARFRAVLDVSR